ncbi:hypothetical protein Q5425_37195 [Amycolatopsis sp. A133]|uniref:hypothetical protein n=1 Tax=Amycolatopsis sp. A133 TaxID=3064472 RepID=UPI0027ED5FB3|nr:hypothetical protein [Amycolatopsis sp. A133]MDQ7809393.1 hypothetical protein [Amycolatopsis sp. A133]
MPNSAASPPSAPPPTAHFYPAETPRGEVVVYSGALDGQSGTRFFKAEGSVSLRWSPSPAMQWSATSPEFDIGFDPTTGHLALEEIRITVPEKHPFRVTPRTPPQQDDARWNGRGPQPRIVVGTPDARDLTHATFLLANLPVMPVAGTLRDKSTWYAGRTVLTGANWKVTLDAPHDHQETQRDLKENGGYAATHTGRVEREDGSDFSTQDLQDVLHILRYALSLACGRWTSPILPVAYNNAAEPTWSEWASPLVSPWRTSFGLVDSHHPEQLQELFARIAAAWADPLKQEVVQRAIYYLIDANDPHPLELAVSSAQSGLELLAWSELVEDRQAHTAGTYKMLKAHESMRELLALHSIDPMFPPELTELSSVAAKLTNLSVGDGPEILTRMRNGVMHPTRTKPKFTSDEWYDAWCLARHYLQLAILGYIGYQGTHRDPAVKVHWTGQIEDVPWNPSNSVTGRQ